MSKLSVRPILANALGVATLLASASVFAADDGCKTIALGIMRCDSHGQLTRESVVADLRSAQADGQLRFVGDQSGPLVKDLVPGDASSLSRAEVKQDLAGAVAAHQLTHGDL